MRPLMPRTGQTPGSSVECRGNGCSLSPGERAGVRGNGQPNQIIFQERTCAPLKQLRAILTNYDLPARGAANPTQSNLLRPNPTKSNQKKNRGPGQTGPAQDRACPKGPDAGSGHS